jgi:hypothetical protein
MFLLSSLRGGTTKRTASKSWIRIVQPLSSITNKPLILFNNSFDIFTTTPPFGHPPKKSEQALQRRRMTHVIPSDVKSEGGRRPGCLNSKIIIGLSFLGLEIALLIKEVKIELRI